MCMNSLQAKYRISAAILAIMVFQDYGQAQSSDEMGAELEAASLNQEAAAERGLLQRVKALEEIVHSLESESVTPIGTIIASILPWGNMPKTFRRSWIPADGRAVPDGSAYSIIRIGISQLEKFDDEFKDGRIHVPDLRGQFIRGLNVFDSSERDNVSSDRQDLEGQRNAGHFQHDQILTHVHMDEGHSHGYTRLKDEDVNAMGSPDPKDAGEHLEDVETRNGRAKLGDPVSQSGKTEIHGPETRPRNVAVYYYIKIN